MSVAGIPSFLEARLVLFRERRNGLYTPLPFVVANTMATIPFLFVCSVVYAVLIYWSVGLHGGASYFFRFLAFLFLAFSRALSSPSDYVYDHKLPKIHYTMRAHTTLAIE